MTMHFDRPPKPDHYGRVMVGIAASAVAALPVLLVVGLVKEFGSAGLIVLAAVLAVVGLAWLVGTLIDKTWGIS